MFNATFTVRPVPGTDKVNVGITPKSFLAITAKTVFWYSMPFIGLIVVSEYADHRSSKKPTNTEDHFPVTD